MGLGKRKKQIASSHPYGQGCYEAQPFEVQIKNTKKKSKKATGALFFIALPWGTPHPSLDPTLA